MKFSKIISLAALGAMMVTASCSDVTDPTLGTPDAALFKLNTPPLQNQYFELHEGGTIEIVANGQPSYGVSVLAQYRAEVSLTEDFKDFKTITPLGTGTQSRMILKQEDIAAAMCQLHGVTSDEDYVDHGIEKIYFRGVAFVSGVEESYVTTSNVVSLNRVQGYFALPQGNFIFCIGSYLGDWIGPDPDQATNLRPYRVTEHTDAIGSNIFYASIDFQENDIIFRYYTALEGWDKNSLGATGGNDDDNPVEFPDFVAGSTLKTPLMATKDSFKFPNYKGVVNMVVDLSVADSPNVTFTTPETAE